MREINRVIVHCSGSDKLMQDSAEQVKVLHTAPPTLRYFWGEYETTGKGWADIGYHYFVQKSGFIKEGRPLHIPGAHARGHNLDSIGICLSGEKEFYPNQLDAAVGLIVYLMWEFDLKRENILGHYEVDKDGKTCPNFNIREVISERIRKIEDEIRPIGI